ncbi:MAG: DUF4167 domain-containing protein [Hyphomicrobiaceae bacterium]|nr:DUF4167 domain-containing protein [Hyphomicrobiaceae bacterium]MCC0011017.1 DUF4167 domain-containing protein [Hyphomicrobiaceae bacterium]
MRQGQQNRRGRGRNRKSQNPLTRSFESNGPDVKIRGTPAHIAEKYISLARDAHTTGDPVLAESYLQHAEHYNRIIMAFREQQIQQGGGDPNQMRRQQSMADIGDGDGDDVGDDGDDEGLGEAVMGTNEPQPTIQSYENQPRRNNNRDRHHAGNRNNNGEHRQGPSEARGERSGSDQPPRQQRDRRNNNRRDFGNAGDEQPEFLRRPVRRTRRPRPDAEGSGETAAAASEDAE